MEFVHEAVAWIAAHKDWAGLTIGLLSFGESMVFLGVLVPGTAILVVVGGLIGAGTLDPVPVLIGAALGAALGDAVSYFIGVAIGRRALTRWPLNRYRAAVIRTRLFFRRYGFATVFFGRFFGPIRATVPLVAGIMGMPTRRFQSANFLSAILWAPVILSPGWLLAREWRRFIRWTEADWFAPAAVLLIATLFVAAILVRMYLVKGRGRPGTVPPPVGL